MFDINPYFVENVSCDIISCSISVGKLGKIEVKKAEIEDSKSMKMGEELPNCGVKDGCGPESFPVHLYSGKGNSDGPKICVSGK